MMTTNKGTFTVLSGTNRHWLWLFLFFSGFNLLAETLDWRMGVLFSKPTLMVWLLLYFWFESKKSSHQRARNLSLVAIISAWAGDVLLLFTEQGSGGELFFLFGLSAFLITHLSYSLVFRRLSDLEKTSRPILLIILLAAFWLTFNTILRPYMPTELQIPVAVYSFVIMLMVYMAYQLNTTRKNSFTHLIWIGALLFLLSDTFIGLNKFGQEFIQIPFVRPLIMINYLTGQFLMIVNLSQEIEE